MPSIESLLGRTKEANHCCSSPKKKTQSKVEDAKRCPHCGRIYTGTPVRRHAETPGKLYKNVFKEDD